MQKSKKSKIANETESESKLSVTISTLSKFANTITKSWKKNCVKIVLNERCEVGNGINSIAKSKNTDTIFVALNIIYAFTSFQKEHISKYG